MMRPNWWCVITLVVLVSACGTEDRPAETAATADEPQREETTAAYEVVLANAISDTLTGSASFGRVRDPHEEHLQLVIRLRSSFDFAGGVIITRISPDLPEEGTYDLTADSAKYAAGEQFVIIYREGMLRDLRSTSGSLTLSTVTDTLIAGEFDAMLRGYISEGSRDIQAGEVHAIGRFRAVRGMSGYVIGL